MPEDHFYKSDLPEDFGKPTKRLVPKTIKQ